MTEDPASLPPVLSVVQRWVRAVWHDHDTPAAVAIMHPVALSQWLPAADAGEALRNAFPWLGDEDVWFGEPVAAGAGPDLDLVTVGIGDVALARILVLRRLHPATDEPEFPTIFRVVSLDPAPIVGQ